MKISVFGSVVFCVGAIALLVMSLIDKTETPQTYIIIAIAAIIAAIILQVIPTESKKER